MLSFTLSLLVGVFCLFPLAPSIHKVDQRLLEAMYRDERGSGSREYTVDTAGPVLADPTDQSVMECPTLSDIRLALGSQIAMEIRHQLRKETGFTCCVGVAHCKPMAKLVSSALKPDNQSTLFDVSLLHVFVFRWVVSLTSIRNASHFAPPRPECNPVFAEQHSAV